MGLFTDAAKKKNPPACNWWVDEGKTVYLNGRLKHEEE